MNVIFLTLVSISDVENRGIYQDLMRKFRNEGHNVYIVTAVERRLGQETSLVDSPGVKILNVKTLNVQKTNILEKGIGTLLIESQFKAAIKKYLGDVKFDLITYSTPPITFTNVVKYLKRKNSQAISYLQLKDIFPQNAVDLGMLNDRLEVRGYGLKSLGKYFLYKFFREKEVELYKNSDYIGCMSPANVEFVLRNNGFIDKSKVEVAPNSIELTNTDDTNLTDIDNQEFENSRNNSLNIEKREKDEKEIRLKEKTEWYYIRKKYQLPTDRPIFIYGGNLGKPQGIDYLIKCLDANKKRQDCFFVVVGNGTEYGKIKAWYNDNLSSNVKLMQRLPEVDYEMLVRSCDVGLIFLDYRFTIPNYPSRLLGYIENKMPVICATDPNTDIGKIAEENGYGFWCESVKPEDFTALVDKVLSADRKAMGERGYEFLKQNYLVENTYNAIMRHFKNS